MSIDSVTGYNPYNMYQNYGYYYPSFNGAYTQQYQNLPLYDFNTLNYNYNNQPSTVTFSANNQVKASTKKQGMSTGAKVAIGAGIATALAIGADFVFCKGKHVKSIFGKAGNKGNKPNNTKPPVNTNTEPIEQTVKQTTSTEVTDPLKSSTAIKADKFESLQDAVCSYKSKLKSGEHGKPENIENMLDSLVEHNYSNDESVVGIMSRTTNKDYHGRAINIKENEILKNRLVITGKNGVKQAPDAVGDYLIQTLEDGRKLVSFVVNTGRMDYVGRPIRSRLTVMSKSNEFTPMQKDLIKIISQRINRITNGPDILSIGALAPDNGSIVLNKDVLLSSIATALKQIKPEEINIEFVNRALKGETVAKCNLA